MSELDDLFRAEDARRGVSAEADPEVEDRFAFAGMLIALRQGAGWSQRRLSAQSGVTQAEISRIENALTVPSVDRAQKLLGALGYRLMPAPIESEAEAAERELVLA